MTDVEISWPEHESYYELREFQHINGNKVFFSYKQSNPLDCQSKAQKIAIMRQQVLDLEETLREEGICAE
jgi:hypothetical protein